MPKIPESDLLRLREEDCNDARVASTADVVVDGSGYKVQPPVCLLCAPLCAALHAPLMCRTSMAPVSRGPQAIRSGLMLLSVLTHCLQCATSLQSVGSQAAHMLPALLKVFHKKAFQQVTCPALRSRVLP